MPPVKGDIWLSFSAVGVGVTLPPSNQRPPPPARTRRARGPITDLFGDGRKEVVVPTFAHYFEVLDGETGVDAEGWPYTHSGIASHADQGA